MTSFAVQSTLGAVAPLVSKDKGSMGNRIDCAGSHIKNNATTALQALAVGGAAAGATAVIAKDGFVTKALSKVFNGCTTGIVNNSPTAGKIIDKIRVGYNNLGNTLCKAINTPSKARAAVLIAAVLLPTLGYIAHKHSYKSGQIDQKYTDKAQFQKTL